MDAVEFAKTMRKICRSHTSCVECEFVKVQGHCGITNPEADHAGMVAVAEQWAKEHPEEAADATKPKQDEPCVTTIQDELGGAIYQTLKNYENRFAEIKSVEDLEKNCYRNFQIIENRHIETCKEIVKLKDRVAKLGVALKAEPVPTPKPKRTRFDVLIEAFPDVVVTVDGPPDICPAKIDADRLCRPWKTTCSECRREYWLAEIDE